MMFTRKDGTYSGTDIIRYPFRIIHHELGIQCRFHDDCLLIVEYDNAQRYLRVKLTGKKKYTSALNIQKMKTGERYIIYEKDKVIYVTS